MIRKSLLYTFFFFLPGIIPAGAESFKSDSLLTILKNNGSAASRKRDLILYLRFAFGDMPKKDLDPARKQAAQLLRSFHEPDSEGIIDFIDAFCLLRQGHSSDAQNLMLKAVDEANKHEDHYLLYACFTHLAFIRTDEGNVIAAISSFRAAKKEATIVDDAYLQILIDINLSDTYYRNGMFAQALFCLDEAQQLIDGHHIENQRMENGTNYNKAEVYFRTQQIDSLKKYNALLHRAKKGTFGLYTFLKRTDYYLTLLQQHYLQAIQTITSLSNDSLYKFRAVDKECLANAYFHAGMLDSAKSVISGLVKDAGEKNHGERSLRFYKLLGDIENKKVDYKDATEAY